MLLADELIGLRVKVVKAADSGKQGITGKIVDETYGTFVVKTAGGEKTVPKDECIFEFFYDKKWVRVDGRMLVARPEDRIKRAGKLSRKWRLPRFFFKRK